MSFLDRVQAGADGAGGRRPISDTLFEQHFPALYEYVTAFQWPDKTPRQTATVTLMLDGDMFKIFVNDRENSRSACMTSDQVMACIELMEEVLAEGKAPWRVQENPVGRKKR